MSSKRAVVFVVALAISVCVVVGSGQARPAASFGWRPSAAGELRAETSQGIEATLGSEGIHVTPTNGGWTLRMALARLGREDAMAEVAPAMPGAEGARATLDRGSVLEWWVNDERGLKHGCTVRERPRGTGVLVLEIELGGDLEALPDGHRDSVAFLRPGSQLAVLHYGGLEVWDADLQPVPARLAPTPGNSGGLQILVEDEGARYPLVVDPLLTAASWSSTETDQPCSVAWGDWDSDGDLDLAVGSYSGKNRVYENVDGTLGSTASWGSDEEDGTRSVAWGDVDGDGDLDLAVANAPQANRVYLNTGGTLTTTASWSSTEENYTREVAWGDMDGDGDLDLAAANGWTGDMSNRVYVNTGGTLETTASWVSTEQDDSYGVAWADAHQDDGRMELAIGNRGQANRVHVNTAGGLLTTASWSSAEAETTVSVAWGDMDGDGDLDLAAGNEGEPTRVYENAGGAVPTFTSAWTSTESDQTRSVAWGDWDGDGDIDLAAGNGRTINQPARVYENTGTTLAATAVWSSGDDMQGFAVAWGDVDSDGDLDLAVADRIGTARVYENAQGTFSSAWSSTDVEEADDVAWGDWDGDGDLDLAVAAYSGEGARVYENTGGALAPVAVWISPYTNSSESVAWGDWDGDGDLDLAEGNVGEPNRVYENTGGGLSPAWTSAESDDTWCVAWGDWDGDGDLDLAAGNNNQPNRVYENVDGALNSNAVWTSAESERTYSVAWGDWDGDADLDLAAGNDGEPNRVYENTASGLVTAWTSNETDQTWSVAWGDWDGDGDLDLAAGNEFQPNRVYENTGGSLDPNAAWTSAESERTYAVLWGDWDGDGDLDLFAVDYQDPIRVYENTGGTLASAWTSTDSENHWGGGALGDWDGDGDLDLATGGYYDPVHVYVNPAVNRPGNLPESAVSPAITLRPGTTDTAFFHSSAECLSSPVTIAYTLTDEESDPARTVVAEYSTSGGAAWTPATVTWTGGNRNVPSDPLGAAHEVEWDAGADGITHEDDVVFRIVVPYQASTRLAGPIQRGAMASVSPPFRVCSSGHFPPIFADGFESGDTSAWSFSTP